MARTGHPSSSSAGSLRLHSVPGRSNLRRRSKREWPFARCLAPESGKRRLALSGSACPASSHRLWSRRCSPRCSLCRGRGFGSPVHRASPYLLGAASTRRLRLGCSTGFSRTSGQRYDRGKRWRTALCFWRNDVFASPRWNHPPRSVERSLCL